MRTSKSGTLFQFGLANLISSQPEFIIMTLPDVKNKHCCPCFLNLGALLPIPFRMHQKYNTQLILWDNGNTRCYECLKPSTLKTTLQERTLLCSYYNCECWDWEIKGFRHPSSCVQITCPRALWSSPVPGMLSRYTPALLICHPWERALHVYHTKLWSPIPLRTPSCVEELYMHASACGQSPILPHCMCGQWCGKSRNYLCGCVVPLCFTWWHLLLFMIAVIFHLSLKELKVCMVLPSPGSGRGYWALVTQVASLTLMPGLHPSRTFAGYDLEGLSRRAGMLVEHQIACKLPNDHWSSLYA